MKVKVYSELTPFRKKKLKLLAFCMSFLWIVFTGFCFNGLITKDTPENAFVFVPLTLLTIISASQIFSTMTIGNDYVRISSEAGKGYPKKIKLNESRDVYIMTTEYCSSRSDRQNGFLISNAPIENPDKKFLRKNTVTVVYSQNFLNALKEHTNLHIIGELKEEVKIL